MGCAGCGSCGVRLPFLWILAEKISGATLISVKANLCFFVRGDRPTLSPIYDDLNVL